MTAATPTTPAAQLTQIAALPLTVGDDGNVRVLLLTSRETKRWVIPKGWPMKGRKPYEAAAQEALEEAGVIGHTKKNPIGSYVYFKRRDSGLPSLSTDSVSPKLSFRFSGLKINLTG